MKHFTIIFTSQGADLTSTRNHFPLQWKRQIFPQKGSEMKYSEVMCYETENQGTVLSLGKYGCSPGAAWRHGLFTHRQSDVSPPRNSCSRHSDLTRCCRLCLLLSRLLVPVYSRSGHTHGSQADTYSVHSVGRVSGAHVGSGSTSYTGKGLLDPTRPESR